MGTHLTHVRAMVLCLMLASCGGSVYLGPRPSDLAATDDVAPPDLAIPIADGHIPAVDGCGNSVVPMSIVPGNVVIVFDQSDSMNQPFVANADGGASGPKYKVAENAILAAIKPIEPLLNVGTIFFPTTATGNTCSLVAPINMAPQIPIEPAATFEQDFAAHFAAKGWALILGTPLLDGLNQADSALPDPSPFKGARAVVIVTDGAPTCKTLQADILVPVQSMFARGIKTYVVGLPGSAGAATLLNAIAMAGGTKNYVAPVDQMALETAFSSFATSTVLSCVIQLGTPAVDPMQLHLVVTDASDPKGVEVPTSGMTGGWTLSNDGTTVTLTGDVCASAESGAYTSLQFVYGCLPPIS